MKRYMAVVVGVSVLAMAVGIVTGCGGTSTQDARAQLTASVQSLEAALAGMTDPNVYSNQSTFNQAIKTVEDRYNAVVEVTKKVKNSKVSALQKAFKDLKNTVTGISSSDSLQQKIAAVSSALTEFQNAIQQILPNATPLK